MVNENKSFIMRWMCGCILNICCFKQTALIRVKGKDSRVFLPIGTNGYQF